LKKLVFATSNINKLREIRRMIGSMYELLSLEDIGHNTEIEEPFETLEANALHKAQTIFNLYNINCFAEDTGLMIEALNGEPGVYSARYAGVQRSANDNIQKVLKNMEDIKNRKAKFKTVVALIINGESHQFIGGLEGVINKLPIGNHGFGYDPIFFYPKFGKTFAQITIDEKNKISHRKKSIEKLINYLKNA